MLHDACGIRELYSDPYFLLAYCERVDLRHLPRGGKEYRGVFALLADMDLAICTMRETDDPGARAAATELARLRSLLIPRWRFALSRPQFILQEIRNYLDPSDGPPGSLSVAVARMPGQGLSLETAKGRVETRSQRHRGAISAITTLPSGGGYLTGGADGRVGLWKAGCEEPLWLVPAHTQPVTVLDASPDGRRALSAGDDGMVLLWDLATSHYRKAPVPKSPSLFDAVWLPIQYGFFANAGEIVVSQGMLCRRIRLSSGEILWEKTGLGSSGPGPSLRRRFDHSAAAAVFASTGSSDRELRIIESDKGHVIETIAVRGFIVCVALSPEGRFVAYSDAQARVEVVEIDGPFRASCLMESPPGALRWLDSPGEMVVVDLQGKMWIVRATAGETRLAILPTGEELERGKAGAIAALPNPDGVIVGLDDGGILEFGARVSSRRVDRRGSRRFGFGILLRDGNGAFVVEDHAGSDSFRSGVAVAYIDRKGRMKELMTGHSGLISGIASSGRGFAMTIDRSGNAALWEGSSRTSSCRVGGSPLSACGGFEDCEDFAVAALDGSLYRISRKGAVPLDYSAARRSVSAIVELIAVNRSRTIVTASADGIVRKLSPGCDWEMPINPDYSLCSSALALSASGDLVGAGDINGTVTVWGPDGASLILLPALHSGRVTSLAFSERGDFLYSTGGDGTLVRTSLAGGEGAVTLLPETPLSIRALPGDVLEVLDCFGAILTFRST